MSNDRIVTWKEFYPYYLREHANPLNRSLHFIGTTLVLLLPILAIILHQGWIFILMPLAGYGFAWVGHFFIEKNRPATFRYPLWSLFSDFVLYYHTITFQLKKKLLEAGVK
jgi:hypothetical protein